MKSLKFVIPAIALVGISMIAVGCSGPFSSSSDDSRSGRSGSGQHVRGNLTGSGREMRPDGTRRSSKNGSGALSASGRIAPPTDGSWAMIPPPDASQKSTDNIAPTGE